MKGYPPVKQPNRSYRVIGEEIINLIEELRSSHGDKAAANLLTSQIHYLFELDRSAGAAWIRHKTTMFKAIGPMHADGSWMLALDVNMEGNRVRVTKS